MPNTPTATPLNAKIWSLAWPMILANLSVPLLGLVDTAVLGHLADSRHLSAVAIGASILSLCYWTFGFLRMGTTGASAQSLEHSDSLLIKAVLLGLALGSVVWLISPALRSPGLTLMNAEGHLRPLADSYLQIRLISAPAVLASYAITGWLLGQQQARWPLAIALFTNILNIFLDLLLIVGLNMASEGAAIASAISEYAGFTLGLYAVRQPLGSAIRRGLLNSLKRGMPMRRLLSANAQILVRTAALLFSFSFFTAQGAKHGEVILAANTILMQLALAAAYGMDGFAHAAEALAGRAYKQADRGAFLEVCKTCGRWSLYSALAASLILATGKPLILSLMTSIADVQATANHYYPWLIALPLLSVASYCYDGIFIGALRTGAMQYCMLFSVFVVYLPLWWACTSWGNHGLWLAFAAFNATRGLTLAACFFWLFSEKRWKYSTPSGNTSFQ
ncbi:MAG: MATE family efflux transporter [Spongiibacter marinus]|uniref:MATE family efflux transporter n=1 Tax=Spongiibacter TaxID=630749 RepID=UPI00257D6574|nr:MATE family efflux transporter [Spongiibacter sp.]